MEESVFRYEKTPNENHPLQHCYFGNYCKNAANRLREEQKYKCVIMDYEHDRAMEQIKLSHKMGVEYALEVLHVDNKNESNSEVKVIYGHFENTVSGWLEKLEKEKLAKASEINKRLKNEVIPITRKLWKLVDEMKQKRIWIPKENNDQGYWMPLISGVPWVLNLYEGEGNPDRNFPVAIIEQVLGGFNDKSLQWLENALTFWKHPKQLLYYAGKHPALYDSVEKSRFLALFFRCTVDYGLAAWLNQKMNWPDFRQRFDGKTSEKVYEKILNHRAADRYCRGSDIVWYTRNALAHFEDNYKDIKEKPWDGGEIVEILDEDLAVCSLHYTFARRIIESQPPKDLTEEGWEETRATKWNKLKAQARARARARPQTPAQIAKAVLSEAYQPAPLEIYTKNNDWDEGWKPVTEEIVANRELLFKTNVGWKKGREVFNRANQPPKLWTNEAWKKGWKKGWRKGWKEAREIEDEANQTVPPEFFTDHGWMTITDIIEAGQPPEFSIWDDAVGEDWLTITEIIKAEQPPRLSMWRKGGIIDGWIEAFEVDRPWKIIEPENWEKAREKLKYFLDSLK